MEKDRSSWKFLDGRDWLRENLSLILTGRTMRSKFLTQFYVEGLGSVPSLLSYYGGGNEDSGYQGGVICMSEVIDISPGNLDSSLCFIQPGICMMYSAYNLNKQGDNIQLWHTPFPVLNQSAVPSPVLTAAAWPAYRFLRRHVRCSGIPSSLIISHSLYWSTQLKVLV